MHKVRSHGRCTDRRAAVITVLMGAPGSGKSTWVARNKTGLEYIYNTEAIRINRDLDVSSYMFALRKKAVKAVEAGRDLIADGTHTSQDHRRVWLHLALRLGLPIKLVVFNTPLATCLAVQKMREFPAPDMVVRSHSYHLRKAMQQIQQEEWTTIEFINR